MIEQRLVDFVHSAPFMELGTRDAKLRPHGVHGLGARADGAAGTIAIFIPDAMGSRSPQDARETGVATIAVGHLSHEAYQFKGQVVEVRPMTEADGAVQGAFFPKCMGALAAMGIKAEGWTLPPPQPGVAVVIRVTDIFVQTPGPGAGARIGP